LVRNCEITSRVVRRSREQQHYVDGYAESELMRIILSLYAGFETLRTTDAYIKRPAAFFTYALDLSLDNYVEIAA
jgi:hypothetical protein